jgi:rhodanese-related sulfurtransferase
MKLLLDRRTVLLSLASMVAVPSSVTAQTAEIWSVSNAHQALKSDLIRMIDVRSRAEWADTGVAENAWAISLHEDRFPERLFEARTLAEGRRIALFCATGGRSGSIMRSLRQAGYGGFIDVSEGMLGSAHGPGWIATGLPVVNMENAISALPKSLV